MDCPRLGFGLARVGTRVIEGLNTGPETVNAGRLNRIAQRCIESAFFSLASTEDLAQGSFFRFNRGLGLDQRKFGDFKSFKSGAEGRHRSTYPSPEALQSIDY